MAPGCDLSGRGLLRILLLDAGHGEAMRAFVEAVQDLKEKLEIVAK